MNSTVQDVAEKGSELQTQQPLKQPLKKPKAEVKKIRGVFEFPAGSGVWWINYYANGKRHREKIGRRGDAITKYQNRKTDALRGIKLPELKLRKSILFEEIAQDALDYSKAHKASYPGDASTVKHLLPTFGKIRVEDITQQTLKAYLDTRTDLTKTTINRYRGTLSLIFQEAIRNGKAKTNPARMVRLYKEDNARIRFITFEEEAVIRSIILKRSPTHEPDFTIALETGMRLSEQHNLTWDRVDLVRRQVQLLKTKNGSARTVVLTAAALKAFKACLKQRKEDTTTDRVFLTRYGEPMSKPRAWFELVMEEAVRQDAALADVTWHIFRHTAISRAVMAGMTIPATMYFAGHKSVAMTMRYSHLAPDYKLAAVDLLTLYRKQEEKKAAKATKPARRRKETPQAL